MGVWASSSAPLPPDAVVTVSCNTTKGTLRIAVNQAWAPIGAARLLDLVKTKYFTNQAFYRAPPNFVLQFGIAADPAQTAYYNQKGGLVDDQDLGLKFKYGVLSYAGSGPQSRTTGLFFATSDYPPQIAAFGTQLWERPIGYVTAETQHVLGDIYTGYGDMLEQGGKGPSQIMLTQFGNGNLKTDFPLMDYFNTCVIVPSTVSDRQQVAIASWPKKFKAADITNECGSVDSDANCATWASQGECDNPVSRPYLQQHCQCSCDLVTSSTTTVALGKKGKKSKKSKKGAKQGKKGNTRVSG